jgi:hypothetical protein
VTNTVTVADKHVVGEAQRMQRYTSLTIVDVLVWDNEQVERVSSLMSRPSYQLTFVVSRQHLEVTIVDCRFILNRVADRAEHKLID